MKKLILCAGILTVLTGCSWRGQLTPDSYIPTQSSGDKEDITVGILNSNPPRPVKYGQSVDYQLDLSNYVYLLQSELASHFENVEIVRRPDECPQCDMFARPRLVFQIIQRADMYRGTMRVDFLSKDQRLIATVSSQTEGDASPSGALMTKTALNQVALGLLAASTIDDYGEMLTQVAEQGIGEMLNDIGSQVQTNPMLTGQAQIARQDSSKSKPLPVAKQYRPFMPAVVEIITQTGTGSGFFISKDGKIITNAHVVGDWAQVHVKHSNGRIVVGKVVKSDKFRDLAMIQTDHISCNPLQLGSESEVEVGAPVFAIGAPKGLESTVTEGIISQARNHDGVRMLQTNTAIAPGSSGGPLIQKETGHVIGINAKVRLDERTGAQIPGLNFAISVNELKDFLAE